MAFVTKFRRQDLIRLLICLTALYLSFVSEE